MTEDQNIKSATHAEELEKLAGELQARQLQLHWILQISKAINYNFPTEQLLGIYEFVLKEQLKVGKLALFMHDETWKCALTYGTEINFAEIDIEQDLIRINESQITRNSTPEWRSNFETIVPVFHKDKPLAYALLADFNQMDANARKESIPFIQTITNIIMVAIENKRLTREQIKQAGIKKELELAAKMQNMLFPSTLPNNEVFEVHATYLPHQEVGGDYYDYISLNDDEFVVCMADVSGKGIAAALLMSNFQANLHAFVKHDTNLLELMEQLNTNVFDSAKGEKFITVFIGRINLRTREIFYINAGHNPPFLHSEERTCLLEEGTTGLGMFEELPFLKHGTAKLAKNAVLLCYTDGVVDLENEANQFYGMDRLKNYLVNNASLPSIEEFHQKLVDELIVYKQKNPFNDDVTLLSVRFK